VKYTTTFKQSSSYIGKIGGAFSVYFPITWKSPWSDPMKFGGGTTAQDVRTKDIQVTVGKSSSSSHTHEREVNIFLDDSDVGKFTIFN
jgi:hypothetical protein